MTFIPITQVEDVRQIGRRWVTSSLTSKLSPSNILLPIMSMHMGDGGDPSLAHLLLSDPRCNSDSCVAFQAAHNASQAHVSYTWQYEYGHWATWYYLIVVFLFMLPHVHCLWKDRRPRPLASQRPSIVNKTVAVWRTICYRRYSGRIADALGLPSIGLQLLILGAIVFAAVATFAVRPYYRGHRGYGSPPLAIRTGLIAVALTPIVVALSGKVNIVTLVTGIGYEKLNVLHRWLSYLCFALSVVHTVPFIVAPLKDGGSSALHKQYYKPGGFEVLPLMPDLRALNELETDWCGFSILGRRLLQSSSSSLPSRFHTSEPEHTSCL